LGSREYVLACIHVRIAVTLVWYGFEFCDLHVRWDDMF
jgi:hypothetical protein